MQKTLDAIYENGVFRPLQPPDIQEGQRVQLLVQETAKGAPEDLLTLAAQVYKGLSQTQIEEVERIALRRQDFFCDRQRP